MKLTDDEKAMLDGSEGPARQKAMEFLVRYAEALGAERFVDTDNVCLTVGASTPFLRDFAVKPGGLDAVFSEFNLDSSEVVEIPRVKAFTCQLITGLDSDHWETQGVAPEVYALHRENEAFCARVGINLMNTCTPYLVGNVPMKGEHCAWMESSAVVYINGALGACTNTEGRESAGAAALTGKIPFWGYHVPENRFGTHLVKVEREVDDITEWGLLGYYIGEIVQERIPVLDGIRHLPNLAKLKHFGAAAASSGGVEMYHIPTLTPEARSLEEAFGGKEPQAVLNYGQAERRIACDNLNARNSSNNIDYVMLGCPHYSLDQLWQVCKLLEGRRINANTALWIFTPRALAAVADRNGYTKIIADAGGTLMSDTCSAIGQVLPRGVKVAATDSAKQAHYLPSIMGVPTWFGTMKECIDAAITGRWSGASA